MDDCTFKRRERTVRGGERGRCSRKGGVAACTLSWRGVWVESDLTERKKVTPEEITEKRIEVQGSF